MNPTVYQFQIPSYGVSYDNILAEIHLSSQHNCHTSPQFNTYNCQGLNSNQQEQTVCNQSSNLLYGYSPPLIPTQKATQTSSFFPDVNFELNNDEALCNTTSIQHILSINRVTLDKCPFCSYKVNIQKIYNQMSPSHPTNEKTLYHIMDQFNQHDCPAQAQYKAKHIIQSELCAHSTSKVVPSILKPQQFVFFNTFLESFTRKLFPVVLLPSGSTPVLSNLRTSAYAKVRMPTSISARHFLRQSNPATVNSTQIRIHSFIDRRWLTDRRAIRSI
ncbi:hypothetical protein PHYBLDRAFT_152163 [Phycomyces blakesleeanus NRRL 1555(-)]|uniref:C2H2-type zinc finger transcription factor n=1 Tax=Phycomyces blakesleeanus (strain ATCC 8743b / DSM 1359 / FGSC 10004 / NBRC 33097 / NRRL 1555) TaxID=763407 RepID=A0A167JSK0_PHYB8|nr:hypothetical protein PHYBLDRAFT_152163 [Phycomyces blakesleeanus NRRL 1555(-)]OAD66618.1 hypothetical protein PHYBLDRAFT_152163 [Phycomyces blakesleeanus NRRL 1555(-)]|eukprot:XP_018284658.1 hypothetical protein PHYBLDRAFT_152163 [Phycomyces blakesleeanus NRRL 1555(-)]